MDTVWQVCHVRHREVVQYGQQVGYADGLDQVRVEAGVARAQAVARLAPPGDRDKGE